MTTKLSPLLCFVSVTILSACSFTHHSQVAREQKPPPHHSSSKSDLNFIDNIAIDHDQTASIHDIHAYHSPDIKQPKVEKSSPLQQKFSTFLNIAPQRVVDNAVLWSFIDNWWGTPYRYGGESRNGIDCSAFVQTLYSIVFNINSLPRTAQEQYEDSKKIKHIKDLKPGDLVFFRIHSRRISHVGVYLQNHKFVNASLSSGVTISDLDKSYWKRYFVCGGEPKEAKESVAFSATPETSDKTLN